MTIRREGITLGLGAAAVGIAPLVFASDRQSLNRLAKAKGTRIGSCLGSGSGGGSFRNACYASLIERECGILVPENEMKRQAIRPSAATFGFRPFDAMLDYAARQKLPVRGHTLLWHRNKWMPTWMGNA